MVSHEETGDVRFSREARILILLVGAGLVLWLLVRVQRVLGPFLWAAITAYIFAPVINWLEARIRVRRVWLVALLYIAGLAAFAWAGTVLLPRVIGQVSDLVRDMPGILTRLLDRLAFLDNYLLVEQIRLYGFTIDPQMLVNEAARSIQSLVTYLTSKAIPAVFNVLEAVGQGVLYLIATFYLLRSGPGLKARLGQLVPRPYRKEGFALLGEVDRVLGAYMRGQLVLIGIMALATFIALSILRVRYALVIALVSGVLEVIPLFGPLMAGSIGVTIALFQPTAPFGWSNLTLALAVAVAYTVLRQIEDQLVVPNLFGPILDLHPLLVLFALFAGGTLAGFTGLVVAVPTAAVLRILLGYLASKIWEEQPTEGPAVGVAAAVPQDSSTPAGETP